MKLKYNLDEIKSYTIEPGRYRAKLMKVENTLSKKKKPMLVWYWKLISGEEKGKTVKFWSSLVEGAEQNIKMVLEALGYKGRVAMDTNNLTGRTAVVVIGITTSTNDEGREVEFPNILKILKDKGAKNVPIEVEDEDDDDEEDDDVDEDEDSDDEDDNEDTDDDDEDEEESAPRKKVLKKKSSAIVLKKKKRRPDPDDDDIPF